MKQRPKIRCAVLILLCAMLCGGTISVAQKAAVFAVAGRVVDALTGDPVRGAIVRLQSKQGTQALFEARAGEDGGFRIEGVAAGKYQFSATRHGYLASFYEQHGDYSSALVVGPGQQTGNLLFGLPPQAILRGTVTGEAGEPVENASVRLYRQPGAESADRKPYRAATAATDDTGLYEFANLPAGTYLLVAAAAPWYALHPASSSASGQPPAELDVVYPLTYFDSTTEEALATPIRLEPGNRIEANLTLHAVPALHLSIANGATGNAITRIQQRVFGGFEEDETAAPSFNENGFVSLAPGRYEFVGSETPRVLAFDARASGAIDLSAGTPAATLSGKIEPTPSQPTLVRMISDDPSQPELSTLVSDGRFTLSNLPAGTWRVQPINGYGYAFQVNALTIAGRRHAGARFTASGNPIEMTVLATEGAVTLEGFAQRAGKGLAGAMIVLVPKDLKNYPALARRDQSDSDGSFALNNVPPGNYTVVAIAEAWTLDWSRPETIARYLPGGASVTVKAGAAGSVRLPQPVAVQPR